MKKTKIIAHHLEFGEFVASLRALSEEMLRKPITEGKWSIIEIIGHLIAWDEFVLHERIPYFVGGGTFPAGPDVTVFNEQAAASTRKKEAAVVLDAFLCGRTRLIERLTEIPDALWETEITIHQSKLTLFSYFKGLMTHDLHHIAQIKEVI